MMNIVDLLSVQRPSKSTRYFQNGVKYRTLCQKCNNELLGHEYDPTLISVCKDVRTHLESRLYLPPEMQIQTKPNRLVRSIVGHILAHGIEEHRNGEVIEEITDYFLDNRQAFPKRLRLYYWVYPYNDQVTIKGAVVSLHYWNSFAFFMLLKFFPLSFFFVLDEPTEWQLPFKRLDNILSAQIDDEATLTVALTGLPSQRWPEAPGESGLVLYGDGATGAIPLAPSKR